MAKLDVKNVLIGHHDPQRTDQQIDEMITLAQAQYQENRLEAVPQARIVGAADRMMLFIPAKERKRSGIVYGRMNFEKGFEVKDEIGPQSSVVSEYKSFDLTQVYWIDDFTAEKVN